MIRAAGMAALAAEHDVFLVDQFGTLHDGVRPYPGALDALRALRRAGARIAVLSNSGKRAQPNIARLDKLGFPPDCYDLFMTSGEIAWRMLRDKRVGPALGARRCLLLARDGDQSLLDGLDLACVTRGQEADLVIIAGSEGDRHPLDHYAELLAPAARRGVPGLCLNPDRTMLTASGRAYGAGRIAALYEEMGGGITWIGKPHPEIYRVVLDTLGGPPPRRVVGVGDSIEHDIAGARAAGCRAALVLTGIVAGATQAELDAELRAHAVTPDFILPGFFW